MGKKNFRPKVGRNYLRQQHHGVPFNEFLLESLRNSLDWGATDIWIGTTDVTRFIIADSARGMSEDRRIAYLSMAESTAGTSNSGKFDTGTKRALIGNADRVDVLTAPDDDLDHVYTFGCATDDYQDTVIKEREVDCDFERKTQKSWPYPWRTGSVITYQITSSRRRYMKRGQALRDLFSGLIPSRYRHMFKVDGESIPAPLIRGQEYRFDIPSDAQLGSVHVNVYRPQKADSSHQLRVASAHLPEVTFREFLKHLTQRQLNALPSIFLLAEVCGIITCPLFRAYAREDRKTLDHTIAEDPRTDALVARLAQMAPGIRLALEIPLESAGTATDETAVARRVLEDVSKYYNPDQVYPPGLTDGRHIDVIEDVDGPPITAGTQTSTQPFDVHCRLQVGIRETLEVTIRPRADPTVRADQLDVNMTRAAGLQLTGKTERTLHFKPIALGKQEIRFRQLGGPWVLRTVKVVEQRKPCFGTTSIEIEVDTEAMLLVENAETEEAGGLTWQSDATVDQATLDWKHGRGKFLGLKPGTYTVWVAVRSSGEEFYCTVKVNDHQLPIEKPLKIGNHYFRLQFQVGERDENDHLITILEGTGVHFLYIYTGHPRYQGWRRSSSVTDNLLLDVFLAYVDFVHYVLRDEDEEDESAMNSVKIPAINEKLRTKAFCMLKETLKAR